MVQEYLDGNQKKALAIQLKYLGLVHKLFCEVNPIPVKWAMNLLGYQAGGLRLPLTELEDEHKVQMEEEMRRLNLLK